MAEQQDKAKTRYVTFTAFLKIENLILLILLVGTWVALGVISRYTVHKDNALEAGLREISRTAPESAPPFPQETMDNFTERLQALEQQTAALHTALATAPSPLLEEPDAPTTPLAQLQAKINLLARDIARSHRSSLVVTAALLRGQVMEGKPYTNEWESILTLSKKDPVLKQYLDKLQPSAETGVLTVTQLQESFHTLLPSLLQASLPEGESLSDEWKRTLAKVATFRKIGNVEGDTAEAVIARAETHLEKGDIAAAIHALTPLQGAAAEAASAWLRDAATKVDAEKTAEALLRYTIRTAYITPNAP